MRSIVSAGDLTMGYRLVFAILSLVAASAAWAGPLHDAARRGDIEDVERLLLLGHEINAKDENDATPLHWAANSGHSAVTKLLIALGADIYANENPACATPPPGAIIAGPPALTELLASQQVDLNATRTNGVTPLHWAAAGGHAVTVRLLIAEGANVNTRTIEGVTPLATAVAMGYDDIAIILRQHGARK